MWMIDESAVALRVTARQSMFSCGGSPKRRAVGKPWQGVLPDPRAIPGIPNKVARIREAARKHGVRMREGGAHGADVERAAPRVVLCGCRKTKICISGRRGLTQLQVRADGEIELSVAGSAGMGRYAHPCSSSMSTASGSSAAGAGLGTWVLRVLDGELVEVAWPPLLRVVRELEMALLQADGQGSLFRRALSSKKNIRATMEQDNAREMS
jgi:hypothetical protein